MGKLKFTLSNILFWISIIASCLVFENVAFLSNNVKEGLDDTAFFLLFTLAFLGYTVYFLIEHLKNKVKVDVPLIVILTAGFICSLISIFAFKGISFASSDPAYNFSYSIDIWNASKQMLSSLLFFVTLYAALFIFNKNYPSIRKLSLLFIIIMVICYVSIIYSLIVEKELYEDIFKNVETTQEMKSLFWNQNMFAGFLLMGIASSMGLNYFKKNPFSYISIPLFFIFIVFTGSLTCILIAIIGALVYFLIEIIFTIKRKVKLGILFLGIYLVTVISAYIVFTCALQVNMGGFSTFCTYLQHKIIAADYQTFTNRTFLWKASFDILKTNPLNLIFGFGFMNSSIIMGGYKSAMLLEEFAPITSHSGYIQILMNFGIAGLLIYGFLIVYYLYCFIRLLKKHTRFALIYITIGLIFLAYASMESVICFNPNVQGILIGVVFFLPMMNKYKHLKRHELGDEVIQQEKPEMMDSDLMTKSLARIFMGLTITSCSLFAFEEFRNIEQLRYLLLNIVATLALFTLFFPFIISCQSSHKSRLKFVITALVNAIVIVGTFTALVVRYYLNPNVMSNDAKWVYFILLAIVLAFEAILLAVLKKKRFTDYLQTFIGISKLSLFSIAGALIPIVVILLSRDKLTTSPFACIVFAVLELEVFYLSGYIFKFKDIKESINHFNDIAIYSLKKEVVKDRLEVMNDKRRY